MKHQEQVSLALVVVAYNKAEILENFCRELSKQDDQDFHLIIVDNSDKVQEVGRIRALARSETIKFRISYFKTDENVGFGAACNRGAREARVAGASHVLFHNYDTYLDTDYLAKLKYRLAQGDRIISPIILKEDGEVTEYRGGDIVDNMFVIVKNKPNSSVSEIISEKPQFDCTSAPGCCLAMTLDVFESVGGFDPSFFVYFEDTDLCKRLRDAGERIHIRTDIRIRHAGSSTSGGTGSYMHYYLYSQGKRVYIRKHFGIPMFYVYFMALVGSFIRVAVGRLTLSQYLASLRGFATPTGR